MALREALKELVKEPSCLCLAVLTSGLAVEGRRRSPDTTALSAEVTGGEGTGRSHWLMLLFTEDPASTTSTAHRSASSGFGRNKSAGISNWSIEQIKSAELGARRRELHCGGDPPVEMWMGGVALGQQRGPTAQSVVKKAG